MNPILASTGEFDAYLQAHAVKATSKSTHTPSRATSQAVSSGQRSGNGTNESSHRSMGRDNMAHPPHKAAVKRSEFKLQLDSPDRHENRKSTAAASKRIIGINKDLRKKTGDRASEDEIENVAKREGTATPVSIRNNRVESEVYTLLSPNRNATNKSPSRSPYRAADRREIRPTPILGGAQGDGTSLGWLSGNLWGAKRSNYASSSSSSYSHSHSQPQSHSLSRNPSELLASSTFNHHTKFTSSARSQELGYSANSNGEDEDSDLDSPQPRPNAPLSSVAPFPSVQSSKPHMFVYEYETAGNQMIPEGQALREGTSRSNAMMQRNSKSDTLRGHPPHSTSTSSGTAPAPASVSIGGEMHFNLAHKVVDAHRALRSHNTEASGGEHPSSARIEGTPLAGTGSRWASSVASLGIGSSRATRTSLRSSWDAFAEPQTSALASANTESSAKKNKYMDGTVIQPRGEAAVSGGGTQVPRYSLTELMSSAGQGDGIGEAKTQSGMSDSATREAKKSGKNKSYFPDELFDLGKDLEAIIGFAASSPSVSHEREVKNLGDAAVSRESNKDKVLKLNKVTGISGNNRSRSSRRTAKGNDLTNSEVDAKLFGYYNDMARNRAQSSLLKRFFVRWTENCRSAKNELYEGKEKPAVAIFLCNRLRSMFSEWRSIYISSEFHQKTLQKLRARRWIRLLRQIGWRRRARQKVAETHHVGRLARSGLAALRTAVCRASARKKRERRLQVAQTEVEGKQLHAVFQGWILAARVSKSRKLVESEHKLRSDKIQRFVQNLALGGNNSNDNDNNSISAAVAVPARGEVDRDMDAARGDTDQARDQRSDREYPSHSGVAPRTTLGVTPTTRSRAVTPSSLRPHRRPMHLTTPGVGSNRPRSSSAFARTAGRSAVGFSPAVPDEGRGRTTGIATGSGAVRGARGGAGAGSSRLFHPTAASSIRSAATVVATATTTTTHRYSGVLTADGSSGVDALSARENADSLEGGHSRRRDYASTESARSIDRRMRAMRHNSSASANASSSVHDGASASTPLNIRSRVDSIGAGRRVNINNNSSDNNRDNNSHGSGNSRAGNGLRGARKTTTTLKPKKAKESEFAFLKAYATESSSNPYDYPLPISDRKLGMVREGSSPQQASSAVHGEAREEPFCGARIEGGERTEGEEEERSDRGRNGGRDGGREGIHGEQGSSIAHGGRSTRPKQNNWMDEPEQQHQQHQLQQLQQPQAKQDGEYVAAGGSFSARSDPVARVAAQVLGRDEHPSEGKVVDGYESEGFDEGEERVEDNRGLLERPLGTPSSGNSRQSHDGSASSVPGSPPSYEQLLALASSAAPVTLGITGNSARRAGLSPATVASQAKQADIAHSTAGTDRASNDSHDRQQKHDDRQDVKSRCQSISRGHGGSNNDAKMAFGQPAVAADSRKERLVELREQAKERVRQRQKELMEQEEMKRRQEEEEYEKLQSTHRRQREASKEASLRTQQESEVLRRKAGKAARFYRSQLLVRCGLAPWRRFMDAVRLNVQKARQFRADKLLERAWGAFLGYVVSRRTDRMRREQRLSALAVAHYRRRVMRHVWKSWKMYGKILRAKGTAVTGQFSRYTLARRSLRAWRIAFVRSQREDARKLSQVSRRGDCVSLRYYWQRWQRHIEDERFNKELESRTDRTWLAVQGWMSKK